MTKIQILERKIDDWKTKYSNLETQYKDIKIERDNLYKVIYSMNLKMEVMEAEIAELKKENKALKEIITNQNEEIQNLKARLNKNIDNSSKPSSTESFKKTIQNNRQKSDKKIGGQPGHQGSTLKLFLEPSEIIEKRPSKRCSCNGLICSSNNYIAKQLVDIEIRTVIKEERVFSGVCGDCGKKHSGSFSEKYINPVQYGENIKAFSTLLNTHGCVSINKTIDIINSITNNKINLSEASLINFQNSFSNNIPETLKSIKDKLIESRVLNADETSCRVDGNTNWIQVFSNSDYTLCNHNKKRGTVSIEEMGILKYFFGILVHDHFSAYYKNKSIDHAECNVHILRYLKAIIEIAKRKWADEMSSFLEKF